ncbi:MAG TPA: hypothetical protein VL173_18670 [Vicinamibacterales bacterium]|nr:hypothetical protein [Vicinamibacterales bacterium]
MSNSPSHLSPVAPAASRVRSQVVLACPRCGSGRHARPADDVMTEGAMTMMNCEACGFTWQEVLSRAAPHDE